MLIKKFNAYVPNFFFLLLDQSEMHFMYILYVFKSVGINGHEQFISKHPSCRIGSQQMMTQLTSAWCHI